jgi:mono/diheme cytochrome c family protein
MTDHAHAGPEAGASAPAAHSVIGLFDTPEALLKAIHEVKPKDLGTLEAYTPYPIHALDGALGLRRSPLGGMVLVMGILGALTALGFQFWISAVDYPIITGGKAPHSWEAFIPIMFEVTVLFSTFTAGLGMLLLLNKLPFFGHPVLQTEAMKAITRDRFALAIEAEEAAIDVEAARTALQAAGAASVEVVPGPDKAPFLTASEMLRAMGGIVAACVVAGVAMYGAIKLFPVLPPMSHMQDQPRMDAQKPSAFFKDGRGMRNPVAGTVARGHLSAGVASQEEAASLVNPLPRTREVLIKGRTAYHNRCEACHGPLANGVPSLTSAYGAKPANLQSQQFRDYPDGKIYWAIVHGKNAMPPHAAELDETQRWAVVHYVRALQRAQNAKDEDLIQAGLR